MLNVSFIWGTPRDRGAIGEAHGSPMSEEIHVVRSAHRFAVTVSAVSGTPSSSSLSLPAGSSADSPATCVNAAYPTIRFFVSGIGVVGVNVVYNGTVIPSGTVVAAGGWAPGPVAVTGSAVTGALNGGTAQVSLRLTGLLG